MGEVKRRWCVALVTVIWMVGIIPPVCIGISSEGLKMSENSSYSHHSDQYWKCSGSVHDCQFSDMEWLMDSEISRRILTGAIHISQAAVKEPKQPAVSCGQGNAYKSCLSDKKNKVDHDKENCRGVYNQNRACRQ